MRSRQAPQAFQAGDARAVECHYEEPVISLAAKYSLGGFIDADGLELASKNSAVIGEEPFRGFRILPFGSVLENHPLVLLILRDAVKAALPCRSEFFGLL